MPISHVITYHFVLPALSEHMGVACRYCRPRLLHFFQLVYNMILVGPGGWLIIRRISATRALNVCEWFWFLRLIKFTCGASNHLKLFTFDTVPGSRPTSFLNKARILPILTAVTAID